MQRPRLHPAYLFLYVSAVATAVGWLLFGLLPALGAAFDPLHEWLHGHRGRGIAGEIATNAAQASHNVTSRGQIALDYLFSLFNLVLSVVLTRLRPRDLTANLLALGMVGSAVAFNLQGHDALQVLPVSWLAVVNAWHEVVHVASGLAYVFALLAFPDGVLMRMRGRFAPLKLILVAFATFFFVSVSLITVSDHTVGLVVLFGVFIPIVGFGAQIRRYVRAHDEDERQRSRVLLWALATATVIAVPLMFLTGATESRSGAETLEYEVAGVRPGTYYFRCDPHPEEMVGVVEVRPGGPRSVVLSATRSEFDLDVFALAAGVPTTIRFTNHDTDLHNVAIYRDKLMNQPIFVGKEFSGAPSGVIAFRIFRLVFGLIPIALIVGLVRFRLWDINRVVNRTLAYGLLAGFVTIAYLALVAGVGLVAGSTARLNPMFSIALAVVVAALFQPLRDRARHLANRIVYGRRATPYELLSAFSARVGASPDPETVIPQLARIVAEATGAAFAEVWLRADKRLLRAAVWPESATSEANQVPIGDAESPDIRGRDRVVAVRHRDEVLGALAVVKPAGETLTPVEERLLEDAAAQAGLALKNVQLTAELQNRLEELRLSRGRIVSAQDEERRRLERDIHDGAQQHLVALSMKLRIAQELAEKDPVGAGALLEELQADTGEALQALRDLARGIHPPVLTDRGLEAALEARGRRCPIPVRVHAFGVGRYPQNIEAAVYFCCSEAIQNAVKHAEAARVTVELRESQGELRFVVSDNGVGFDPPSVKSSGITNMIDRLAAVAGNVEISSTPGRGTIVTGRVPVS